MRLRSSDSFAGVPVLRVRSGLRRIDQLSATIEGASRLFCVPSSTALRLVRELVARGILEPDPGVRGWYRLMACGNAFAHASAAPPLRRETVDRRLIELVERMLHVNACDDLLVGIERAYVFGSYLSDAERDKPTPTTTDVSNEEDAGPIPPLAAHESRGDVDTLMATLAAETEEG